MIFRFFILLIGFGLAVAGGVTLILYMNMIPIGRSYGDFVRFAVGRIEFYMLVTGFVLIWTSLWFPFNK